MYRLLRFPLLVENSLSNRCHFYYHSPPQNNKVYLPKSWRFVLWFKESIYAILMIFLFAFLFLTLNLSSIFLQSLGYNGCMLSSCVIYWLCHYRLSKYVESDPNWPFRLRNHSTWDIFHTFSHRNTSFLHQLSRTVRVPPKHTNLLSLSFKTILICPQHYRLHSIPYPATNISRLYLPLDFSLWNGDMAPLLSIETLLQKSSNQKNPSFFVLILVYHGT